MYRTNRCPGRSASKVEDRVVVVGVQVMTAADPRQKIRFERAYDLFCITLFVELVNPTDRGASAIDDETKSLCDPVDTAVIAENPAIAGRLCISDEGVVRVGLPPV